MTSNPAIRVAHCGRPTRSNPYTAVSCMSQVGCFQLRSLFSLTLHKTSIPIAFTRYMLLQQKAQHAIEARVPRAYTAPRRANAIAL